MAILDDITRLPDELLKFLEPYWQYWFIPVILLVVYLVYMLAS